MAKSTENLEGNTNDMNSRSVLIRLKDGTELNVVENGTTFESKTVVKVAKLTDENLKEVQIGDEHFTDMTLVSLYPWEKGTRFALREMTEQELENARKDEMIAELQETIIEDEQAITDLEIEIERLKDTFEV